MSSLSSVAGGHGQAATARQGPPTSSPRPPSSIRRPPTMPCLPSLARRAPSLSPKRSNPNPSCAYDRRSPPFRASPSSSEWGNWTASPCYASWRKESGREASKRPRHHHLHRLRPATVSEHAAVALELLRPHRAELRDKGNALRPPRPFSPSLARCFVAAVHFGSGRRAPPSPSRSPATIWLAAPPISFAVSSRARSSSPFVCTCTVAPPPSVAVPQLRRDASRQRQHDLRRGLTPWSN